MGKVQYLQGNQTVTILQNHLENAFAELIVGSVDVADSLDKLSHSLKTRIRQIIVADFKAPDFVDASGTMDVVDNFVTGQAAIGDIEEVRKSVFAELKVYFLGFLDLVFFVTLLNFFIQVTMVTFPAGVLDEFDWRFEGTEFRYWPFTDLGRKERRCSLFEVRRVDIALGLDSGALLLHATKMFDIAFSTLGGANRSFFNFGRRRNGGDVYFQARVVVEERVGT